MTDSGKILAYFILAMLCSMALALFSISIYGL